jgi:hypothetical protein
MKERMPRAKVSTWDADRDLAFQGVIEGEIDDAETADPQHLLNLEFAQAGARRQCIVLGYGGHAMAIVRRPCRRPLQPCQ